MSTELVLALRLEAKAAKAGIDEIRTALAALKREAAGASGGGGTSSRGSRGPTPLQQAKIDTEGIIGEQKRRTEAAKTAANEIIGANKAITAASQSASAQRIAWARSAAAEDQRLSAATKYFSAEDKRASMSRLSGIREASAEEKRALQDRLGAVRQGLAEDKRASGQRLALTRELASEDKRASAGRIAASKEASAAAVGANRTAASSSQAAAQSTRAQTAEIQRQAAALRLTRLEQAGLTGATHAHTNALGQALKTGAQLAAVYGTLRAVQASLGAGIDYNKTLEGAKLAIASVVAANEKVVDSQGRQIEGVEKLRVAQTQVASVMDQLVIKARETGTPIQVLVAGFQAAVAPASAIGLTLGQTSDIVVGLTNAMKAMNIPLDQQRQEIQDILNADIDRNSHVAKNMQLNGTILKQWKEQGTLAQNLLMLLKDYNVAAGEFKNTWGGATAVMKGNFEALMGVLTGTTFDTLKDRFKELSDYFGSEDAREKAKMYGAALKSGLDAAYEVALLIGTVLDRSAQGYIRMAGIFKARDAVQVAQDASQATWRREFAGMQVSPAEARAMAEGVAPPGGKWSGKLTADQMRGIRQPTGTVGEDYRQYIGGLTNVTPEQKKMLMQAAGRAGVAGEVARGKFMGILTEKEQKEMLGSVYPSAGGNYTTSPAGGVGTSPADKEKAEKALRNALKLARAGREGVPQASAVVKAYEQFLGNKALDQPQIKVDLQAARQELAQAIAKAAGKDAKQAGKQTFGEQLQAQALSDMPDESAALREMRELLAQGDPLEKARNRWMQGANKRPKIAADLTRIDRDSSMRLRGIDRAEEVAKAGFDPDPTSRLNKEIALRRQAIEDEFNARREDAEALASTEMDARLKILAEANAFRRESEAQLRSDERIGRMQIEDEAGKKRLEFAMQAAGFVAGAIRGGGSTGSMISGLAGLAGGAAALIPGGQVAGAGIGVGGQILGSVVDKFAEIFDAERQKQLDILKRQDDVAKATEAAANAMSDAEQQIRSRVRSEQVKKIADAIAAGKDIDDEIAEIKRKTDLKARNATPKEVAESDAKAMIEARKKALSEQLGVPIPFGDPTNAGQGMRSITSIPNGVGGAIAGGVKGIGDWWNNLPFWVKNKTEGPPAAQIPFPKQSAPDLPLTGSTGQTMTGAVGDPEAVRYDPAPQLAKPTYTYSLKPVAPYLEQKTENVANDLGAKFDALEKALLRNFEVSESRGTERNPLIIKPPKGDAFAYLDRSALMRQARQGASRAINVAGNVKSGRGRTNQSVGV